VKFGRVLFEIAIVCTTTGGEVTNALPPTGIKTVNKCYLLGNGLPQ